MTNECPISNAQSMPLGRPGAAFGHCSLVILWSLELAHWSFLSLPAQHIILIHPSFRSHGRVRARGAIGAEGPDHDVSRHQPASQWVIKAVLGLAVVSEADGHDVGVSPRVSKNAVL